MYDEMRRHRHDAISVLFLKEGEIMLNPSIIIGVFSLVLMTIQIIIMWLERHDRKKMDSSARDSKHTDESNNTHTCL